MRSTGLSAACLVLAAAGSTALTADGESPGTVEVPYRRVKHQVLVDVHVNGQGPFTFLIDTGVAGAAIDSGLAARLGIELDEESSREMAFGPDKKSRIYQTHIPRLAVGALEVGTLQAAALPLGTLGDKLGEPLHGILGDGFLKTRATRFDHADLTVSFAPSLEAFAADVAAADYIVPLVIGPDGDMPLVEVTLDGKSLTASIDTGSSLGLEIFTPYAEEYGLGHAMQEWETTSVTGGSIGEAISHDGTLESIAIGPLHFTNVPTSITPPRYDRDRKGNIGNQVWEGYVLIFDYPGKKIVFRKKS